MASKKRKVIEEPPWPSKDSHRSSLTSSNSILTTKKIPVPTWYSLLSVKVEELQPFGIILEYNKLSNTGKTLSLPELPVEKVKQLCWQFGFVVFRGFPPLSRSVS